MYAPTVDKSTNEVEEFYGQLEQALELTKVAEVNIILGDLNAKVSTVKVANIVVTID